MAKKLVLVVLFALQMATITSLVSVSTAAADEGYPTCFPCGD